MSATPTNPEGDLAEVAPDDGRTVIRAALKTMPGVPGVYRMLNRRGEVLYVGKARNLKRRVGSYANRTGHTHRILNMIAATASMEIVTTHTEVEALLLESNLIKRLKPRFNVLLRDDKSFPYIMIRRDHEWAQITKHRGVRDRDAEYFGPFSSAGAVNRTLSALQRAFPLRSCSDSVLEKRTRPCLQYQIKRCAAPCVGKIKNDDYEEIVQQARDFLTGKSHEIQQRLASLMTSSAESLDYETAAMYRDRIKALAHIQARQGINVQTVDEADVIALHQEADQICVQVFFFRGGQNFADGLDYSRDNGMRVITIEEFDDLGWKAVAQEAKRVVGDGPAYLTFDVDGLDPVYTPGTGTPEAGGITMREAQRLIRGLTGLDFIGGDVVEVSPPLDPSGNTALNAATILFEMLCILAVQVSESRSRAK